MVHILASPQWKRPQSFAALVLGAVMIMVTGCAKAKPVVLSFEGKADMNGGFACRVCLYQLKNDAAFLASPPEAFWGSAPAAFQGDLTEARTEVMLDPGETRALKIKLAKDTNFIGAAADFRQPERDAWRKVVPVSSKKGLIPSVLKKGRRLTVTVSSGGIEIQS